MSEHISVLLEESIAALDIQPDGIYLDATFGRGGHSRLILAQLSEQGRLYAVDRDPQAEMTALAINDPRFRFARVPFSQIGHAFADVGEGTLDGILFDLGVSSPQLDQAERGFSFAKDGPLDMRMDNHSGTTAKEWLDEVSEAELSRAIRDLGGETHSIARRIARAVIGARQHINSTLDLAEVVSEAMPKKYHRPGYHPATQTFQAIRMSVNDEVGEIERALASATALLKNGGVLAVITFHGLEDALVKRFIRAREGKDLPAEIPSQNGRIGQELALIRPLIKPSPSAVAANPRCRSARLRKAVKV